MKEKTKILLVAVNAKYIHSNPAVFSLKKYSGKYKDNIEIAEYTINHQKNYILEQIYKKHADIVAFSCYIWNYDYILEIASELHMVAPDIKILLGGPEVTYDAISVLENNKNISLIMRGEGEATFKELCELYIDKTIELNKVQGITFRKDDKVIQNVDRKLLDMDTIPFYYDDLDIFENKIIYYEASRGCPFSCSYCLSSVERSVRFRSIDIVKKELLIFLDKKIPQVKFVDRTFNINHQFTIDIWKYIMANDNGITNFHFEISADLLNEEEIGLIEKMRPGLIQLEIGVQSTNDFTIKEIERKMDFNRLSDIVKRIRKGNNVHQHLDLIAGLPYEDLNSFRKSYNNVYALKPQQLQLGFLKVLKGSKMHLKYKDYGIKYQCKPPYEVLCTTELSYDDILVIKLVEEMTEIYYNSGQFEKTLMLLEKAFDNAFDMFWKIGLFYENNGLRGINHSRIKRYEILKSFVEKYDSMNMKIYEELLLYDLYLRENLKSRPEWAHNIEYKKITRDFYSNEEYIKKYLSEYDGYDTRQIMRMTHLELFSNDYSKWTEEPLMEDNEKKYLILFDYKKRSIMNYSAKATKISEI